MSLFCQLFSVYEEKVDIFIVFWKRNQFFLLIMGALVMFMQCGFAFLEAGAVRSKEFGINDLKSLDSNDIFGPNDNFIP